jgi:hypothetical protein
MKTLPCADVRASDCEAMFRGATRPRGAGPGPAALVGSARDLSGHDDPGEPQARGDPRRVTSLLQPAYDSLDSAARALVDTRAAELEGEPPETVRMFRFLVAMVAVKRGDLCEVHRGELHGRPIVVLADEQSEALYQVEDPGLGEVEEGLVEEMERVLSGESAACLAIEPAVEAL